MRLVPVLQAERDESLPIAASTAYKWHSQCQHPKLIVKVSNKLFFDFDEWENMARERIEKRVQEANRLRG